MVTITLEKTATVIVTASQTIILVWVYIATAGESGNVQYIYTYNCTSLNTPLHLF